MTKKQVYACPISECSYQAGTAGSVKGHVTASTAGNHRGISGPSVADDIETVDVEEHAEQAGSAEQSTAEEHAGEHAESVTFPAAERAEQAGSAEQAGADQCCDDPALEGEAGALYQLGNGEIVRLDDGDQICMSCDQIHE